MKKTKFFLVFLAFLGLTAFKSDQNKPGIEAGLFKVSVLYPGGQGKTFDMDYYEKSHMPMMAGFLGKNLKFYEIDKGLSPGRTPNDEPPFVAVLNDIKKYTNIQPVIFISEIKQVR